MTENSILTCNSFPTTGITHGFLTRNIRDSSHVYGNNDTQYLAEYSKNREIALAMLNLPHKKLQLLHQVHGCNVVQVDSPWESGDEPMADGFVSNCPDIVLGIVTADCVPILFADPKNKVIGAAHSGWKSTRLGIGAKIIEQMMELGAERAQIQAVIGPCIQMDSYEVGPEFFEEFIQKDKITALFFKPSIKSGHYQFDLPGYVSSQLMLEIPQVHNLQQDTYTQPDLFFSYRRSTHQQKKLDGLLLSMISLG